jgi:hypothetical protein
MAVSASVGCNVLGCLKAEVIYSRHCSVSPNSYSETSKNNFMTAINVACGDIKILNRSFRRGSEGAILYLYYKTTGA